MTQPRLCDYLSLVCALSANWPVEHQVLRSCRDNLCAQIKAWAPADFWGTEIIPFSLDFLPSDTIMPVYRRWTGQTITSTLAHKAAALKLSSPSTHDHLESSKLWRVIMWVACPQADGSLLITVFAVSGSNVVTEVELRMDSVVGRCKRI